MKASVKAVLLMRNNKCSYCGKVMERNDITKDHFVPKGEGGRDHFINQPPCCHDCNKKKGNMHPLKFIASILGDQQLRNFHDALRKMEQVQSMTSQKISKMAKKWDERYGGKKSKKEGIDDEKE